MMSADNSYVATYIQNSENSEKVFNVCVMEKYMRESLIFFPIKIPSLAPLRIVIHLFVFLTLLMTSDCTFLDGISNMQFVLPQNGDGCVCEEGRKVMKLP